MKSFDIEVNLGNISGIMSQEYKESISYKIRIMSVYNDEGVEKYT